MGRSGKKDPKLSEVKAVLQRLQGFTEEGKPVDTQSAGKGARAGRAETAIVGGIILAMAAGILGTALFVGFYRHEPAPPVIVETAEPVSPDVVKGALEAARSLMAKGQVRAAREKLLALARRGAPDAAWDLARSYDPNVLSAIPTADAAPDIEEATRWYRAWYTAAVRQGMVADSVSLERIIGSMRQ
jgi:hypothetical protein